jgi:hypothetical protein
MDDNYIMLSAECGNRDIIGFIIGKLMPALAVYHAGGLTLKINVS